MRVLKALNGVKTIDDQIEREAMRSSGIIEEESTSSATLVKITFENVAIIEAMISYDSKYTRNSDPRSVPDKKWLKEFKDKFDKTPEAHEPLGQNSPALLEYNFNGYRGSSAFWMHRLGEYYGYNYGNEFNGFDSVKRLPLVLQIPHLQCGMRRRCREQHPYQRRQSRTKRAHRQDCRKQRQFIGTIERHKELPSNRNT